VNRRDVALLIGAAAAWPLAGHAQQPERMRRIGALMSLPESAPLAQAYVTAFAQALGRFGWVEGNSVRIDYRFAASDPILFKTYAAELVGLSPAAILATSSAAIAALHQQTRTIPVVFSLVADPVGQGLFRASRDPAAISPGSVPSKRRYWGNGCNCSRRSR
jgi:putative ABC transport system substrate-binding protein